MRLKTYVFSLCLICCVVQVKAQKQPLTVAFYNLENLYDTINDTKINDEEFLPTGKLNWTSERYKKKLANLTEVISGIGTKGPDFLGVCEIENRTVLDDLNTSLNPITGKYEIVHFNSPDVRGIDVAFFYRPNVFKLLKAHPVRINLPTDTGFHTRDILYVEGIHTTGNKKSKEPDTLHFLVNHFPSRRGGGEESQPKRILVAQNNRRIVDSLLTINSKSKIIILGDLNDEPANVSLHETLKASTSASPDSLTGSKLFNTLGPLKARKEGTLFYKGEFNMLDNIIISQGLLTSKKGLHLKDGEGHIYKTDKMQQTDEKYKGAPFRTYIGQKYTGGYSDHFPVYIQLQ